jgi:hypothetical protein
MPRLEGHPRVVDHRRISGLDVDAELGPICARGPFGQPFERIDGVIACRRAQVPDRALELRGRRDDVRRLARDDTRHCHDQRIHRVGCPAGDLADLADEPPRDRDGIDRAMRHRGMATAAVDPDSEAVAARHERAWGEARGTDVHLAPEMAPQHGVDAVHHPCLHEVARPARRHLLCVLEDESQLTIERACNLRQRVGGADQHRRVAVMTAGVHHSRACRAERDVAVLLDR